MQRVVYFCKSPKLKAMKKLFLSAMCICLSISVFAQNPETKAAAKKIANAVDPSYGPCYTTDGQRGNLKVSSQSVTTSNSSTSSNTNNSPSRSYTGSTSVGTSTGISASQQYNSGSSANTNTNSNSGSTTTNYICVPNKQ